MEQLKDILNTFPSVTLNIGHYTVSLFTKGFWGFNNDGEPIVKYRELLSKLINSGKTQWEHVDLNEQLINCDRYIDELDNEIHLNQLEDKGTILIGGKYHFVEGPIWEDDVSVFINEDYEIACSYGNSIVTKLYGKGELTTEECAFYQIRMNGLERILQISNIRMWEYFDSERNFAKIDEIIQNTLHLCIPLIQDKSKTQFEKENYLIKQFCLDNVIKEEQNITTEVDNMIGGFIYILRNESFKPGILKIGMTSRSPIERSKELSKPTGIPSKFEVVHVEFVNNFKRAEKLIHEALKEFHYNKEFFKVDVSFAINTVRRICDSLKSI